MNIAVKLKNRYLSLSVEFKAALWFTVCSFLTKGIKFFTEIIFSHILETDQYGLLSVYNAWTEILFILATLRLSAGVYQRGLLQYKKNKYEFTIALMKLSFLFCAVWAVLLLGFSGIVQNFTGFRTGLLVITVLHFGFQVAFEFWISERRFEFEYRSVVALTLCVCIFGTAASIFSVYLISRTAYAKIISQVLADTLIYIWVFILLIGHYRKEKNSPDFTVIGNKAFWKYALAFNLPLIPHYLSQTILNQSDRIMIGKMVSSSMAGIYGVAYTIGMVIQILQSSLFLTLQPWRYKNMEKKNYASIGRTSTGILVFFGIVDILFMAVSPEIITLFFRPVYREAMDIIPAISLGSFFLFLYSYFGNIEFYFKKTRFTMVTSMICAGLNIVLNYFGIIFFGYKACAYATLICYMVFALLHYIAMKAICRKEIPGVNIYNARLLLLICAVTCMGALGIRMLYPYIIVRYAVIAAILIGMLINRKKIMGLLKLKER